ncbi:hypothetical protein KY313_02205 [Candidatus Woesearchaeota archaeon]|jgi:DNA-binding response OmpR family regulator|nr:hypothetical protein [Candidatus Woesearchaeota archaeon]
MKDTSELENQLREYGKKNILIVDTKKNYNLEQILNKVGYSATMVTSEKAALQTFFDTPFDIILSEIFFEDGDFSVENFYDLIPKLKVIDEKALFMGMTTEKKNISRMGNKDIISNRPKIDEYLWRPFEREDFYKKIKALIKRRDEEVLDSQVRFMVRLNDWQTYESRVSVGKLSDKRHRLTHFTNYFHDRISMNAGMVHPSFATDCATGIITNINPDRKYGEVKEVGVANEYSHKEVFESGHQAYYIKKFEDTSNVTQHREDLKLFLNYNKLNKGNEFKLPNLIFSCPSIPKDRRESLEKLVDAEDNQLLSLPSRHRQVICEVTIGPSIGYVFKKLNEQINVVTLTNKQRNWYSNILNLIMEVNINELNVWQNNTELLNGVTERSIKNKLISGYKENMIDAITDFNHYNISNDKDPNRLTEKDFNNFKESLSLFDNLTNRDINLFSRNLDNSPGNSGWDMRRVNVGIKELLHNFGLKKHDKYPGGYLPQINRKIKQNIQRKFAHWDQAFKNSHILEDLFHIIDSYEFNIKKDNSGNPPHKSLGKRLYHYTNFMKGVNDRLNNFEDNDPKFWLDFLLMGYYRNLRKRNLFITKYAVRNEELFKNNKINKQTYDNKIQEHKSQMMHYGQMAKQYAFIGCDFFKKSRSKYFSKNKTTIKMLSTPSLSNTSLEKATEDVTTNSLKGIAPSTKAKLEYMDGLQDSNNEKDKEISNYFRNLYSVASKISRSNNINFDKLKR